MKPWLIEHQQLLAQQFTQGILPHAILITGVKGSGKLQLAKWLTKLLACQSPINSSDQHNLLSACGRCKTCLLEQSNTLPDHLNVVAEKNSIGVDDVRFANNFLQKTAQLGLYKTVLIEHSEIMTVPAANALLKTLEEPTDNSIIILLTAEPDSLLATIISRTRVLNIRPVVGKALMEKLTDINSSVLDNHSEISHKTNFVNLTQLPELTEQAVNEAFKFFKQTYLTFLYEQQGESELLQQVLNNEHSLRWLEQITVNLQRQRLLFKNDLSSTQHSLSSQVLDQLYKVIINRCKIIKSYPQANKQFFCEQLIMALSDIVEQNKI